MKALYSFLLQASLGIYLTCWSLPLQKKEYSMVKKLTPYAQKREFTKTPEPKPKVKSSKSKNIFVVQQHHASHMHFDFRLEMDGVLKSWAIPKGPSLDPSVKRLAALTEDHPLDYATFEGIIPEGYGAGTVIVWDQGTYKNITEQKGKPCSIEQAFKNGHIKITLKGKKLKGDFVLMHFKDKNWLLIKLADKYANTQEPVVEKPQSVRSRKTIKTLDKQFDRPTKKGRV